MILKLSKAKVYYLIQRRQIPHIRVGRNVRIRASDLEKWLAKKMVASDGLSDVWYIPN